MPTIALTDLPDRIILVIQFQVGWATRLPTRSIEILID